MNLSRTTLAIDCRMINSSGIGRYISDMLENFIRLDVFKKIIYLGYKSDFKSDFHKHNVEFIHLTSKIFTIKEQIELYYKIPKCDIFWSPQYNVPILPIKAKRRLVTIHDVYQLAYFSELSLLKKMYVKTMMNFSVKLSDYILTDSVFSKKEIIKYTSVDKNKISVIYLGLSDTFSNKESIPIINEKYFLFVGNIKPHKNLKRLISAYKLFLKDNKNYVLYLVGKKDGFLNGDNGIEQDIIGFEKYIKFTGFISDNKLKEYYKSSSLFIFPSLYEGFGYPVLEEMFFNVKIIASNIASIPEVGGKNMIYFDPYNIDDIVLKIKQALSDNIVDYSEQLNAFTINKMILNYVNFFENLD